MSKAAYCSECKANVYVNPEGRCPKGHGPEFLSNYYDTEAASAATPTPSPTPVPTQATQQMPTVQPISPADSITPVNKKGKSGLIIVLVILALLLLCGVGGGIATCAYLNTTEETVVVLDEDVADPVEDEDRDETPAQTPTEPPAETPPPATVDESGMGPDTTPPLVPGTTRVVLGWDQEADMDLEIWDASGNELLVRAFREHGGDVTNGNLGREYFDFTGDYATGEYVISVYFAAHNDGSRSSTAKLLIYPPSGDVQTRSAVVRYDVGLDQWHAFRINAVTGAIVDVDEFIDIETTE